MKFLQTVATVTGVIIPLTLNMKTEVKGQEGSHALAGVNYATVVSVDI